MADVTVTPAAFGLALTLASPTVLFPIQTVLPGTLELALKLPPARAVTPFPLIGRTPSHKFSDETTKTAVLVGSTASGYPVLNKQFTFDPRTFSVELRSVIDADKLIVMDFYELNKDFVFPWYNDQDDTWYEVCFIVKPRCRMDGRKDLWRINLELMQTTP